MTYVKRENFEHRKCPFSFGASCFSSFTSSPRRIRRGQNKCSASIVERRTKSCRRFLRRQRSCSLNGEGESFPLTFTTGFEFAVIVRGVVHQRSEIVRCDPLANRLQEKMRERERTIGFPFHSSHCFVFFVQISEAARV